MDRVGIKQMKRKRHAQMIRRRAAFLLFTSALILFLALTGFHMNAKATEHSFADAIKYYRSIQIMPGDTLWSIADTYMDNHYKDISDYIEDIAKTNNISPRTGLKSGEFLIIPYYSQSAAASSAGERNF